MKYRNNQKGITILSLTVLIIILIILATVTVSVLTGENGILERAVTAQETHRIGVVTEKLSMSLGELEAANGNKVSLAEYLEYLKHKNDPSIKVEENELNSDKVTYVLVDDKYEYKLEEDDDGNVSYEYMGTIDESSSLQVSDYSVHVKYPEDTIITITKNATGGELSISNSNPELAEVRLEGNKIIITPGDTAGETTITLTSTIDGKETTITILVIIENGKLTVHADDVEAEYDGKSHKFVVTVDEEGSTITYSTDGENYSTESPEYTDADTYTVYYKVENQGYKTVSGSKTVTIRAASNTLTLSETSGTIAYPNTGEFTITGNISGGSISVQSSDENVAIATLNGNKVTITPNPQDSTKNIKIYVTSESTRNYQVETVEYDLTVEQGTLTVEARDYSGYYDENSHEISISVAERGATITYSTDGENYTRVSPSFSNVNTYTVYYKVTLDGYKTVSGSKTIIINKANNLLTLSENSGDTAYPINRTITVIGNKSGGALSVSSSDESVATATIEGNVITISPKNLQNDATATITVTSAATDNYEAQTATYTLNVISKKYRITVANGQFSDGSVSKEFSYGATATATASGLLSDYWEEWQNDGAGRQVKNHYTYAWSGETTKSITVTKDETILFSYTSNVDQTKYKYLVNFEGYDAYNGWTDDNGNGTYTLPEAQTREGYDFKGWSTSSSATSGSEAGSQVTVSGPTTYYPVWERKQFTVTVTNGRFADGTSTKTFNWGDTATATAYGLLEGYWSGWSNDGESKQYQRHYSYQWVGDTEKSITVTDNASISFEYEEVCDRTDWKYKVSFSGYSSYDGWTDNNGEGKFTLPVAQTKEGHQFKGWSTTEGATEGTAASTEVTVSGPTTYYAAWQKNRYTITVTNGQFSDGSTSKVFDWGATATANATGLPSASSTSWTDSGTGKQYKTNYSYSWNGATEKSVTVTKDETIAFSYTQQNDGTVWRYKVSFSGYSSLDGWTNDNGNGTFTLPGAPSNTGYKFKGWSTTSGASSGTAAGAQVTLTGPATYYATWEQQYLITVTNGQFSDGTTSKYFSYGETATATATGLPSGYWGSWTDSGTGKQYQKHYSYSWSGNTTKSITVTGSSSISFSYTSSEDNTIWRYKVSFSGYSSYDRWTDSNGNGTFTFPSAPSQSGYNFKGWSTNSSATSGTAAGSSGSVSSPTTYYATWEQIITYKIVFNINGGSGSVPSTISLQGKSATSDISSTCPTRSGYTFGGWSATTSWSTKRIAYSSSSGGGSVGGTSATITGSSWNIDTYCTNTGGSLNSNNTLNLYAQWYDAAASATYRIVFNLNGGSGSVPSTITLNGTSATSDIGTACPTRSNYQFGGWSSTTSWSTKRIAYSSSSSYGGGTINGSSATTTSGSWNIDNYCSYTGTSRSSLSQSGTTYTLNLYAQWYYTGSSGGGGGGGTTTTYKVVFNGNGNTGGTVPSQVSLSGTTGTGNIGSGVPTKTGYTFAGWSASSSWSTKRIVYSTSTSYGGGSYGGSSAVQTSSSWNINNYITNTGSSYTTSNLPSNTLTLYAQWYSNTYTLSVKYDIPTEYYHDSALPADYASKYIFSSTNYTRQVSAGTSVTVTASIKSPTTDSQYTYIPKNSGETISREEECIVGDQRYKKYYTPSFSGWYNNSRITTASQYSSSSTYTFTMPSSNHSVYALGNCSESQTGLQKCTKVSGTYYPEVMPTQYHIYTDKSTSSSSSSYVYYPNDSTEYDILPTYDSSWAPIDYNTITNVPAGAMIQARGYVEMPCAYNTSSGGYASGKVYFPNVDPDWKLYFQGDKKRTGGPLLTVEYRGTYTKRGKSAYRTGTVHAGSVTPQAKDIDYYFGQIPHPMTEKNTKVVTWTNQ